MNNLLNRSNISEVKEPGIVYRITITALILFYIFDGINKVLTTYSFPFTRSSIFIRAIFEVLFLFIIIRYYNRIRLLFLVTIVCFFLFFIAGQLIFSTGVNYEYNLSENITIFNKYIYIFIIYFAIYRLKSDPIKFGRCIEILENIFVINSFAILIGIVTGWEFLKSYVGMDYRYGYMGFIPAQNEATLFYFLAISFAYYKRFVLKIKTIKFYFIILPALFLGTKGIYVFFILLIVFHLFYYANNITRILTTLIVAAGLIKIVQYATSDEGRIALFFFYDNVEKNGWLTMLLSGRDDFVNTKIVAVINNWNIVNYLFGGQDQNRFFIEMDFFDIFLFFGIIGSIFYLFVMLNTIFQVRKIYPFFIFFTGSFFLLAFLGGHFFSSAINSIYLCLVSMYFYVSKHPV